MKGIKQVFYRYLYKLLWFLSDYFDNRYLRKYKIILGTSLLMITSACQNPKKDNSEEVLCYEMPAEYEDTIHIQSHDSSDIMCYDVAIEPEPEIIPEVMCYEPAPDFYVAVEQMPVFPGRDKELMDYIQEKMIYPKKAIKDGIQGKVYVSFEVEYRSQQANYGETR